MSRRQSIREKIMSRVSVDPVTGCWLWTGPTSGTTGRGHGYRTGGYYSSGVYYRSYDRDRHYRDYDRRDWRHHREWRDRRDWRGDYRYRPRPSSAGQMYGVIVR